MELPLRTYYGINSRSNLGQSKPAQSMDGGGDSTQSCASNKVQKKSMESCKSHKEAERRRRQRINGHLSTLRSLLPNTTKTDKASLLAEVVNHVKELRKKVIEVERCRKGRIGGGFDSELELFPGEADELTLSYCDYSAKVIKAMICCEDRPGLNHELTQAMKSVGATAVKAEITTVGGRSKTVVVMKWSDGGGEKVVALKRALKAVLGNQDRLPGRDLTRNNKRHRCYSSGGGDGASDDEILLQSV